jgi:hypothetical protein
MRLRRASRIWTLQADGRFVCDHRNSYKSCSLVIIGSLTLWTILLLQVLASLWLYRQILDAIKANDYNNFTKRAYVGKAKKLLSLPMAYAKAAVAS